MTADAVPAIELTDLVRRYGDVRAVDGVSFSVRPSEFFAMLEPSGARHAGRARRASASVQGA